MMRKEECGCTDLEERSRVDWSDDFSSVILLATCEVYSSY